MQLNPTIISPAYTPVIRQALGTQLIVGILAALLLDGGVIARVVGVAVLASWLGVAMVIVRRPYEPTKFDLGLVEWGFWIVLAIAALRQMLA